MKPYLTTPAAGIRSTRILADAMDGAPHPYTAAELAALTGIPLTVTVGWLNRNLAAGKISARRVQRPTLLGKPITEYWRGEASIMDTWAEVPDMTERTEQDISEGRRPVSWRDGTRTSWSVDELGTVTAMKGRSVVRMGQLERMERTGDGMKLSIKDGPVLIFARGRK